MPRHLIAAAAARPAATPAILATAARAAVAVQTRIALRTAAGARAVLAAIALAAMAVPAAAAPPASDASIAASGTALRIATSPARPAAAMPLRLEIDGFAEHACVPRVAGIERRRIAVDVRLEAVHECATGAAGASLVASAPDGMRWGGSGVYRIRVLGDALPGGDARVLGFRLLQVGRPGRTLNPEAGYWWNEAGGEFDQAGPGLGINLERQGDTLSVTVLGYAEDGRPEWLFGAGPIEGRIARVPLSRLQDGAGPFQPYRAPGSAQSAGVLHLEFHSEARAAAWFEREDAHGLTLRPLSLVRFRFDDAHAHAALGDWLIVEGSGGDTASATLSLRFERSEPTLDGFRVLTGDGGHALECLVDEGRPNSPAERCVLRDADGMLLVDFRDIALQRMRGWRPNGARVTALRGPAE